jgi:ABC-type Na+ efflux pump permease subunit
MILSTVRPRHLMAGKVIGIGLLGLGQVALVGGCSSRFAFPDRPVEERAHAVLEPGQEDQLSAARAPVAVAQPRVAAVWHRRPGECVASGNRVERS